jgi:hypothetical protein
MVTIAMIRRWCLTFASAIALPAGLLAGCANDSTNPIPIVPGYTAPDSGLDGDADAGATVHASDSGATASDSGQDAPPAPNDGALPED